MSGDPKVALTAFCNGMIRIIKQSYPEVETSYIAPNPYQCGRLRAFEQLKRELEKFEKTYTISAILSMLESQYQEPITKEARELMIKEMDHFEALN